MKKLLPLLSIVLALLATSCEKETLEISNEGIAPLVTQNVAQKTSCTSEYDLFERRLQWFSFISAKVLRYNTAARSEVQGEIFGFNDDTVEAELLLGTTLSNFEAAFENEFIYYVGTCCPDPDTEGGKPDEPIIPDPISPLTPQQKYELFVNYMVDDNCVELYFPNGLNFSGSFQLTSTSHPLTSSASNEGTLRYYNMQYGFDTVEGGGGTGSPYITEGVCVDDAYAANNNNIIVARPIRNTQSVDPDCSYTNYEGINFTLFLD